MGHFKKEDIGKLVKITREPTDAEWQGIGDVEVPEELFSKGMYINDVNTFYGHQAIRFVTEKNTSYLPGKSVTCWYPSVCCEFCNENVVFLTNE